MTALPFILPAVWQTAHGYRNGIYPAFPPRAVIPSLQIFSDDWAIWSGKAVFATMDVDGVFGRSDIAAITKDSVTAAGNLITKLKNADLIEPVSGFGKGKYKFIPPKE